MKRTLFFILLSAWLISPTAWAYSFYADAIYYNITSSSDKTVEVTCKSISDGDYSGDVIIPAMVTNEGIEYRVTAIGERAFVYCSGLTSVTIPESVTTIGDYAFRGCTGLSSITISNSVTTIGSSAFSGCTNLKNLRIEDGTETLVLSTSSSWTPFDDCPLNTVYLGRNIDYIYYNSPFKNKTDLVSLTIGNQVTSIGSWAFDGCTGLTSVTIGSNVTSIDYAAFDGCTGLTSVTIPNSVTTIDRMAFSGCDGLTEFKGKFASSDNRCLVVNDTLKAFAPSGLTQYTIPNEVKVIDDYAFYGCEGLTSVTIPNSVTSIGDEAFYRCTGLTSVTIPNSVTTIDRRAFYRCTGLTSITIGKSVTSISDFAFYDCNRLKKVTIPNSVTTIGDHTFSGCTELKNLRIEDGTETLTLSTSSSSTPFVSCPLDTIYLGRNISYSSNSSPFKDKTSLVSLTIGNQVTSIGSWAFDGCTSLMEITIPNSVTSIGYKAFYRCIGLKNLRIEDGTETLALNSSFDDCPLDTIYLGRNISYESSPFKDKTSLVSLTIGNRVMTISYSAFSGCTGLTEVTIPNSVTTIGNYAFYGCIGLSSITIPDSVTTISNYTFFGCTGLTSVTIPNSVTTIGDYTFYGCTELKNLRIEDGTETLSLSTSSFDACPLDTVYLGRNIDYSYSSGYNTYYYSPFNGNPSLVSLTIGTQVTSIGNYAFYGCEGLTSVTIPESVDSIGNYAFSDCKNLQEITPLGTIPPSINDNTFDQYIYQNATVNYPKGSLHIYKNADGWKNFTYPSVQTILDLQIDSNIGETTCRITISYTPDMEYPTRGLSFCMGEEQFTFDSTQTVIPLTFADLDPQTRYEAKFIIETVYGEQAVTPITFTTNAVRLTAQPAKNTDVKATLEAEVECDAETGYGFEWRRHGAPDNVPPARVEAYNIDGKIAGTLRNLTPNTYYEFRPYYRSASGKYYYGSYAGKDNWIGFGTFDYGVEWDPAVNTRTSEVHGNNSTISAYVVEGSDELLSQGFEYWAERAETPVSRSTASNPERIEGSGSLMSVTLTGLDYNTTYYYRAYATTAKKTTYGNTESFTTGEDPNLSGIEETEAAANAEFEVRLSGNPVRNGEIGVQVVGADGATWYRVISLHGSLITQGVLSGTDEWQPVKIPAASTGYYLLQIIGSKGTKTLRIVVE